MSKNVKYGKRRQRENEENSPKDSKEITSDYKGPDPRPGCDCKGWGCWGCCDNEDRIRSMQGTFG